MNTPFFIAEVGVNFYDTARVKKITPLQAAKEYIKAAKECGADAVKFQSYKADTIVSKNSPAYWDLGKEPTKTQYDLFKKHDGFNREDYFELYQYAKKQNIKFMSTPFDYQSADYLEEMVDIYKVSSSDISNIPFLKYIAGKGKPIYLSVGASYISEIDEAVRVIKKSGENVLCLMHCVLSYPCKFEDANLNIIRTLKRLYPDLIVGYSDHTLPDESMQILSTAYLLGAEIIEKHFTLDKNLPGNDHYHAGDPNDFRKAVNNFKLIKTSLGSRKKTVFDCELVPRREARRSLTLTRKVMAGEMIQPQDLMAKRPGTGIAPSFENIIVGRSPKFDLEEDTVLTWDMI